MIAAVDSARVVLSELPGCDAVLPPRSPRTLDLMALGVLPAVAADIDSRIEHGLRGYGVIGLLLARTQLSVGTCWRLAVKQWGVGPKLIAESESAS